MTKIWLINCIEKDLKKYVDMKYEGLGLAYIASYIRKYGGFKDIIITDNGRDFDSKLIKKINPNVIGISSITQNFNIASDIAKKIKNERDIPIIVGGYHITALPNNLTENMDIAVLGEGEQTFLELLYAYEKNGLDKNKLSVINGLAYWLGGRFVVTSKRKLIKPLDEIPFPARDLLQNFSGDFYMFTSRGCPYSCVFCSSSAFWGNIRFFSAEYVINEIKELIDKYKVKHICFYDDLFIADKRRVQKIVQLIKKEKIDIYFSCSLRANLINNEMALLLKRMNVRKVSLGLESGCDKTLNYLKGDTVTVKQNLNAVKILKKHGFSVGASFVIGSPNETEQECLETLDFIRKSKINVGETYVLLPFPNTKLWEYGKQKGLLNDYMNWDNFKIYFSDNINRVIISNKISREKLIYLDSLFKNEWKKRYIKYLIFYAIRYFDEIPFFVIKKIKKKIRKLEK